MGIENEEGADKTTPLGRLVFRGRDGWCGPKINYRQPNADDRLQGLFLNKVVIPGYIGHLKTFVASLNRNINRGPILEHFAQLIQKEAESEVSSWCEKDDIHLFESVSKLVHKTIVQCLMGPDFYEYNVEELYHLLEQMEGNIGSILNFILPDWVPHPAALRLRAARDRVGEIFVERLKARDKEPEKWMDAKDYISGTFADPATAHLRQYYAAHHTLLMFAAHTSTVASISWALLNVRPLPISPPEFKNIGTDNPSSSNPQHILRPYGKTWHNVPIPANPATWTP